MASRRLVEAQRQNGTCASPPTYILNGRFRPAGVEIVRTVLWPAQPRHRQIRSDPRPGGGEADIDPVAGVADDREGGEQVPHAAPAGGRNPAPRRDRSVEHNVHRVGRGGRYHHTQGQPEIDMPHSPHLARQQNGIATLEHATGGVAASRISARLPDRRGPPGEREYSWPAARSASAAAESRRRSAHRLRPRRTAGCAARA